MTDSLRSIIEKALDEAEATVRECKAMLAIMRRPPLSAGIPAPIAKPARAPKPAAESRTLPLPPKAPKKQAKSTGKKRSALTVARQRIGQAKRRGKEPSAKDMAFVATQENFARSDAKAAE